MNQSSYIRYSKSPQPVVAGKFCYHRAAKLQARYSRPLNWQHGPSDVRFLFIQLRLRLEVDDIRNMLKSIFHISGRCKCPMSVI